MIGGFAIGAGLFLKRVISSPIECINDKMVEVLFYLKKLLEITSFSIFYFIKKFKKLLHLNKEI